MIFLLMTLIVTGLVIFMLIEGLECQSCQYKPKHFLANLLSNQCCDNRGLFNDCRWQYSTMLHPLLQSPVLNCCFQLYKLQLIWRNYCPDDIFVFWLLTKAQNWAFCQVNVGGELVILYATISITSWFMSIPLIMEPSVYLVVMFKLKLLKQSA